MESKHQEIENKDSLLYPKEVHKCTECDKTFSTKYVMKDHLKSVHVQLNSRKTCMFCQKKNNNQ